MATKIYGHKPNAIRNGAGRGDENFCPRAHKRSRNKLCYL